MVRWALVALASLTLLVLTGCAPAPNVTPGPTAEAFRIVAYNAEWLFDGVGDPDGAPWSDRPEADRHLQDVAGVLGRPGGDFIGLAEVEDAAILGRLNDLLGGGYESVFVQGTDVATGQDVAALTKIQPSATPCRSERRASYPVPGSVLACATGDSGVSKHYAIDLTILGFPVTILGTHLRAYPDRCKEAAQREAQAKVLADLARDARGRGREIVILGDLNDYDGAVPDSAGSRPISIVLATLKDLDPSTPGDELDNVCARLPQSERYTCWYDRDDDGKDDGGSERSQIDFVLVSRRLAALVTAVSIDHSTPAGSVSDHWAVVVDLALSTSAAP